MLLCAIGIDRNPYPPTLMMHGDVCRMSLDDNSAGGRKDYHPAPFFVASFLAFFVY